MVKGHTFKLCIENVTGDSKPDFYIQGILDDYPEWEGSAVEKNWIGTLSIPAVNNSVCAITILEEAIRNLALAVTEANDITLQSREIESGSFF